MLAYMLPQRRDSRIVSLYKVCLKLEMSHMFIMDFAQVHILFPPL